MLTGQAAVRSYSFILELACAVAIMLGTTFHAVSSRASEANPAEIFIQQNIDRGNAILNNAGLSDVQRHAQFRSFILSVTDPRRIGMFTLGPYANGASKAVIDAFIAAFSDYLVANYESGLTKYKGKTMKVTGSIQRAPDDVVVNVRVVDPDNADAQAITVAFRVRKAAGGRPVVTDIRVEGIWFALSDRSDFTDFLQQHRGSIPALIQLLKMKAQHINDLPG